MGLSGSPSAVSLSVALSLSLSCPGKPCHPQLRCSLSQPSRGYCTSDRRRRCALPTWPVRYSAAPPLSPPRTFPSHEPSSPLSLLCSASPFPHPPRHSGIRLRSHRERASTKKKYRRDASTRGAKACLRARGAHASPPPPPPMP